MPLFESGQAKQALMWAEPQKIEILFKFVVGGTCEPNKPNEPSLKMNTNEQTEMTCLEQLLYAAKAVQKLNKDRELIAEYRAIAKEEGKVWNELTECEITEMIIANETRKELARQAELEAFKCPEPTPIVLEVNLHRNLCVNCCVDMGDDNPRQFCCKTHCPNEEGEYRVVQVQAEQDQAEQDQAEQDQAEQELCIKKHNRFFTHSDPTCGCACPNYHNAICLCFVEQACRDYYAAQRIFPCNGALNCQSDTCGCDEALQNRQHKEWMQKQEEENGIKCPKQTTMKEPIKPCIKRFNLLEGTAPQVYKHLYELTEGFSLLEPSVAGTLIRRISQQEVKTTFGHLPAPYNTDIIDVDIIKQIIGKDGCYFKMTTLNTGVDFIWHDRAENQFCFWGPKENVLKAMKIIQGRIDKYNAF